MDTGESIKALAVAGKSAQVRTLLAKAGDDAAQTYAPILNDDTLSDTGRQQYLARAYVDIRRGIDQKLEKMAAAEIRHDRDDAGQVFGTRGLPGDAASLAISRRDAGDRVAAITDAKELGDLLKRATRSGDEILARAVAQRAVEMQGPLGAEVMTEFLADRPTLEAAGERLWNAERATHDQLGSTMLLANLRPAELMGMATDQIEVLAATEAPAPPKAEPSRANMFHQAGGWHDSY